jgi:hypothetical protein
VLSSESGQLLGKSGSTLNNIRAKCNTIKISFDNDHGPWRLLTVTGDLHGVAQAVDLIEETGVDLIPLQIYSGCDRDLSPPKSCRKELKLVSGVAGELLGQGGARLNRIRSLCPGARLSLGNDAAQWRILTITGSEASVAQAAQLVSEELDLLLERPCKKLRSSYKEMAAQSNIIQISCVASGEVGSIKDHWDLAALGACEARTYHEFRGARIRPGNRVAIRGLISSQGMQLNGLQGILKHFDPITSRWHVELGERGCKSIKSDNFSLVVRVPQPGLTQEQSRTWFLLDVLRDAWDKMLPLMYRLADVLPLYGIGMKHISDHAETVDFWVKEAVAYPRRKMLLGLDPSGARTTFEAFNWRTISGRRVTEVLRQVYGESWHRDIILLNYNPFLTFTKDDSSFNFEKVVNLIEQSSNPEHHSLMSDLLQQCSSFLKQVIVATQVQAILPVGVFTHRRLQLDRVQEAFPQLVLMAGVPHPASDVWNPQILMRVLA